MGIFEKSKSGGLSLLIRALVAAEVITWFILLSLVSLYLFSDVLPYIPSSRVVQFLTVFFASVFALCSCMATSTALISLFRAVLWTQSMIRAIWRSYTAPLHYVMSGKIHTKSNTLRLTHSRQMEPHLDSPEIRRTLQYHVAQGILLSYLVFGTIAISILYVFEGYQDNSPRKTISGWLGNTTYKLLEFLYSLITSLLSEFAAISFAMSRLRDFVGDDLLIFILVVGVILTSIPVRNLIHYREIQVRNDDYQIVISTLFATMFVVGIWNL